MRNGLMLAALVLTGIAACGQPTDVRDFETATFLLVAIDGKALPVNPAAWSSGNRVEAGQLELQPFSRSSEGSGVAHLRLLVNGSEAATRHHYVVVGGILHIDFCPIGALCSPVPIELVGEAAATPLLLTYSVGATGTATLSSVFRFERIVAD